MKQQLPIELWAAILGSLLFASFVNGQPIVRNLATTNAVPPFAGTNAPTIFNLTSVGTLNGESADFSDSASAANFTAGPGQPAVPSFRARASAAQSAATFQVENNSGTTVFTTIGPEGGLAVGIDGGIFPGNGNVWAIGTITGAVVSAATMNVNTGNVTTVVAGELVGLTTTGSLTNASGSRVAFISDTNGIAADKADTNAPTLWDVTAVGTVNLTGTNVQVGSMRAVTVPRQDIYTNTLVIGDGGQALSLSGPAPLGPISHGKGSKNTLVGFGAGNKLQSGYGNTYIGEEAGYWDINGAQNTYVGWMAGFVNSNGFHDTYIGVGASQQNPNGIYNVSIGTDCNLGGTAGSYNVYVGNSAANYVSKSNNVVIGDYAAYYGTNVDASVIIGRGAGLWGDSVSYATIVGYGALTLATNGMYSTIIGDRAAYSSKTATENTVVGGSAFYSSVAGRYNSVVGRQSAFYMGGDYNSTLGYKAGFGAGSTAANNVFLGALSDVATTVGTNVQNSIAIGYQTRVTNNNEVVLGNPSIANTWLKGHVNVISNLNVSGSIMAEGLDVTGNVNFSGTSNYVGTLTIGGSVVATNGGAFGNYQEVWIPAGAMNPGAGSPNWVTNSWSDTTDNQKLECWGLDSASDEALQFTLTLPDEWDAGTLKAKVHWKAENATSGSVVWGVAAGSLADGETGGNSLGTAVTVTNAAQSSIEKLAVSAATGAITVGGSPALGHLIWFRVYRDADNGSDDMANDARLIGVQLQYKTKSSVTAGW